MKRNSSKFIFYIFCTFIFFATSCTHDSANYTIGDANSRSLYLQISTDSDLSTRSLNKEASNFDAAINENKIDRLDIFFYQGEQLKWHVENVSYNEEGKKAQIPLNQKAESLFDGVKQYDIYVVANGPARSDMTNKTLSQLKNIVHTHDFGVTNQKGSPKNFLMDGKLPLKAVSLTDINLGTVNMKRAAAKIRVRIFKGSKIVGAEFTPYIAVKNCNNKTALLQDGSPSPTALSSDIDYTKATTEYTESSLALPGLSHLPIYSYENDWSKPENKANETHIMIRVDYKADASSEVEEYFYKIPINAPTKKNVGGKKYHCIERNHIYDINVTINELSGDENKPVTLQGNYEIKDWTTKEVALEVTEHHFLFVHPSVGEMKNTNQYELSFSSSKYPVWIKDEDVSYSYVDAEEGVEEKKKILSGDPHYPSIVLTQGSQLINISSLIPENNVPKDIVFTVTNGIEALDQKVQIRQYPPVYITNEMSRASSRREDGEFGWHEKHYLNNKALYIYNTILPDGNTIIGFPPLDNDGYVVNSEEVAKMVSPAFMGASQLGAAPPMYSPVARGYCKNYWETATDREKPYKDWRLPTNAEIALMNRLQYDEKSAVKVVMSGRWYWSSYVKENKAYWMGQGIESASSEDKAPARCVRDVK